MRLRQTSAHVSLDLAPRRAVCRRPAARHVSRLAADRVLFAARHGRLAASRQGAGGDGLVQDPRDTRHVAAMPSRGCTRALLLRGLPGRRRRSRVGARRCMGARRTQEQAADERSEKADHRGRDLECEESSQIHNTLNTARRSRLVRGSSRRNLGKNTTLIPQPGGSAAGGPARACSFLTRTDGPSLPPTVAHLRGRLPRQTAHGARFRTLRSTRATSPPWRRSPSRRASGPCPRAPSL